jgi:hypothetical protein
MWLVPMSRAASRQEKTLKLGAEKDLKSFPVDKMEIVSHNRKAHLISSGKFPCLSAQATAAAKTPFTKSR